MKPLTKRPPRLPKAFSLKGHVVRLRHLAREDRSQLVAFAQELPPDDLLFLLRDITQAAEVDRWLQESERGDLVTIVAWAQDRLIGYATFDRGTVPWTRHVAEIRVVVAQSMRGIGVGGLLLELAFELALEEGVSKVVARMTPDQSRALALFERLGFEREAILRGHAMDGDGQTRDLLLLSFRTKEDQGNHCEGCGASVLTGLFLENARLCSLCYELRYQELGAGD